MTDARDQQPEDDEETPSILEEEPEAEQAGAQGGDRGGESGGESGGQSGGGALESLLDGLSEAAEDHDAVTVDEIVDAFEHRSIGALISVIALISALPLVGGIPGVTLITATLMLMIIGQSLAHRRGGIWVPRFLGERSISSETVGKAVDKSRPWMRRIDRWMHPRLEFVTQGRPQRLAMIVVMVLLVLSYYPLNFIPYAVSAPSFGVVALGLALMSGDGVLALVGYAMAAATLGISAELLSGGFEAVMGDD